MLKIKELFNLPSTSVAWSEWPLRDDWFVELGSIWYQSTKMMARLEQDQRLQVFRLKDPYVDGNRIAALHTLWFDTQPLMFVKNGGRNGTDDQGRWIVDKELFTNACAYLLGLMFQCDQEDAGPSDFVSMETEVYPEELLCVGGNNYCQDFGIPEEPRAPGFLLLAHQSGGTSGVWPTTKTGDAILLVEPKVKEVPNFVRRGSLVFRKVREIPAVELDKTNPRIRATMTPPGSSAVYEFEACARPQSEKVVRI